MKNLVVIDWIVDTDFIKYQTNLCLYIIYFVIFNINIANMRNYLQLFRSGIRAFGVSGGIMKEDYLFCYLFYIAMNRFEIFMYTITYIV